MSCDPCFQDWVGELAREHTRWLAAAARREGLSGDAALDAVQDAFGTFLRLPEARGLGERGEDARRFLVTLVRNAARNLRRRHHHARPHVPLGEDSAGVTDSAEELAALAEDRARLAGCLSQLGEAQRRVVTLRVLEEASGEDVAKMLGLTAGHVAVLLHRAKKDLASCMTA